jgi:hypothetical protein
MDQPVSMVRVQTLSLPVHCIRVDDVIIADMAYGSGRSKTRTMNAAFT